MTETSFNPDDVVVELVFYKDGTVAAVWSDGDPEDEVRKFGVFMSNALMELLSSGESWAVEAIKTITAKELERMRRELGGVDYAEASA